MIVYFYKRKQEALGGIFERKESYRDNIFSVYWINVDESLEKHKDTYEMEKIKLYNLNRLGWC